MEVSLVNSAGGRFCWNYANDIFYDTYADDNVCSIYAVFEVVTFVTGMLVDLSLVFKQVTVSVTIMQVKFLRHICR